MKIAVNARFLLDNYLEGYGYFLYETFSRIVKDHPEHEFLFIFDRPFNPKFIFAPNVKAVVAGPPARHPILWRIWYNLRIPALLRKHKADIFVSCDGFCSLGSKKPQCLVVHDLAFLHFPSFINKSQLRFYKKYTPRFLSKAASIATVSTFSKNDIIRQYHTPADKISVVYSAVKEIFQPLSPAACSAVKEQYTGGREYFIYTGSVHPRKNLVNLLKAFSIFKKRQQSNFKLVIAGRLAWKNEEFTRKLDLYKYKDEVLLTGYVDESELARLTGAAYALVYPSFWEGFGVPVLEAMRCGVPVVTSVNSAMQEIGEDAALFANPDDYNDIADKIMRLYKDEPLRNELIRKGKMIEAQYSWQRTSSLLWEAIMQATPLKSKN